MNASPSFVVFSDVSLHMRSDSSLEKEVVFGVDPCSSTSPYGKDSPVRCLSLRSGLSSELRYFTTDKVWIVLEGSVTVSDVFGCVAKCSRECGCRFEVGEGCLVQITPSPDVLLLDISIADGAPSQVDQFDAYLLPRQQVGSEECFSRYSSQDIEIAYLKSPGFWEGKVPCPSLSQPYRIVMRVLEGSFQFRDSPTSTLSLVVDDLVIGSGELLADLSTTEGGSLVVIFLAEGKREGSQSVSCVDAHFTAGRGATSMKLHC